MSLLGPPIATSVWSALMSAARTLSYSFPISSTRSPVLTFQTTTRPSFAPRPPAARSSCPFRLNLRT